MTSASWRHFFAAHGYLAVSTQFNLEVRFVILLIGFWFMVQSCKWRHLRPFELIYFKPARRVKRIKKKTIIVGKYVFHAFTQTCVNCVILWTKYQKHLSAWHRTLKVTSALIHPDGCQQRTKHFQDVAPVPAIQYVRLINWQQESIFCHLV